MRAALAGLVVVAVTACGGGGANNERLTKQELVQRANGVCAEYERKVKALGNPQTLTDLVTYARSAHEALADGLEQLRKLHPPAELEAKYDTWVAAGDRALERNEELQKAAAKGDQIEIQRLVNAARREGEQSDRLASQLGMTECAND